MLLSSQFNNYICSFLFHGFSNDPFYQNKSRGDPKRRDCHTFLRSHHYRVRYCSLFPQFVIQSFERVQSDQKCFMFLSFLSENLYGLSENSKSCGAPWCKELIKINRNSKILTRRYLTVSHFLLYTNMGPSQKKIENDLNIRAVMVLENKSIPNHSFVV